MNNQICSFNISTKGTVQRVILLSFSDSLIRIHFLQLDHAIEALRVTFTNEQFEWVVLQLNNCSNIVCHWDEKEFATQQFPWSSDSALITKNFKRIGSIIFFNEHEISELINISRIIGNIIRNYDRQRS